MTLKKTINVRPFGLSEKENFRLSKIFQLSREDKRLYYLDNSDDIKSIDIAIVNTRSSSAIEQFNLFRNINPTIALVTIGPKSSHHHLASILIPSGVYRILDAISLGQLTNEKAQAAIDNEAQTGKQQFTVPVQTTVITEAPNQHSKYQALVVDDSETIQKAVAIEIRNIIFEIDIDYASSGEEALEHINDKQYDLIFLDIMMPGIDGFETCSIIRKKGNMKKTPIIMLTSKKAALDELKGSLSGCSSYLTKPVKRTELYSLKLPRLLARSRKTTSEQKEKTSRPIRVEATKKPEYKILVVDDSEMMQKTLEVNIQLVENAIMHIDFANNGKDALKLVNNLQYDLVFLDIMMPGIDGFETCRLMRQKVEMKKTPIVMVTNKTLPLDEVDGLVAGCTTYLTKPLNHEKFQRMMESILIWLKRLKGK